MPNNKEDKDAFLEFIGKVKPLKESGKNVRKIKPITKTIKKIKNIIKPQIVQQDKEKTITNARHNLNIEKSPIAKKLKRGKIPINKKIDFHGLSLVEAKNKFIKTINECFYSNDRCILFVTGKGIKKSNSDQTNTRLFHGKIRENFQRWVFEKDVSSKILNIAPAGFSHGGDGAFFVYLRKNKN